MQVASVPNSTLVPLSTLPSAINRLERDLEYVVLCHHGMRSEISAEDAIAIAAASAPAAVAGRIEGGFAMGQTVAVKTDGSGDAPVSGRMARIDPTGITVLREGTRCGAVAVHFPRLGQMVLAV